MNGYEILKSIPQWVGWNAEERAGKITKVPKDPHTGKNASSNNPSTWGTAQQAWNAKSRYNWTGVGYVFTLDAGIVGVDLDDCFEPGELPDTKRLKPWAMDIYRMLQSFTEYSPSGNGLHIYARGAIPGSINRSTEGVEMYDELRYFTVTGQVFYPGPKENPIPDRSTELQALHWCFADNAPTEQPRRDFAAKSIDEKTIREAIQHIPVHQDYYDWLRVLMAVHDALPGADGVALIESWSPGYKGEVARKFRSFDRTAKDGVTIGTLFHMAQAHGWQRPKPPQNGYKKRTRAYDLRNAL